MELPKRRFPFEEGTARALASVSKHVPRKCSVEEREDDMDVRSGSDRGVE